MIRQQRKGGQASCARYGRWVSAQCQAAVPHYLQRPGNQRTDGPRQVGRNLTFDEGGSEGSSTRA